MIRRVLIVSNSYAPDDTSPLGSAVRLQAEGLRALGVDVRVLLFDRLTHGRTVYLFMPAQIRRSMCDFHPDIVHLHFGGIPAVQLVRSAGAKSIITFHGTDLHGGSPRTIAERISFLVAVAASKWAAHRTAWNIVVSENLRAALVPATNVTVIPTGVDYAVFRPEAQALAQSKLGLDASKRHILFCDSSHEGVKRRELASACIAELQKTCPTATLLELHGVPHRLVPDYLNSADCLLVTSAKEGSPNIVKEAIATNTPVVSTDVGDVSKRLSGVRQCHIAAADPRQLAIALAEVLGATQRANGREIKRSEIENSAVCHRLLQVYHNVVANHLGC